MLESQDRPGRESQVGPISSLRRQSQSEDQDRKGPESQEGEDGLGELSSAAQTALRSRAQRTQIHAEAWALEVALTMPEDAYAELRGFAHRNLLHYTENRKRELKSALWRDAAFSIFLPAVLAVIGFLVAGPVTATLVILVGAVHLGGNAALGRTLITSYRKDAARIDAWYGDWRGRFDLILQTDDAKLRDYRKDLLALTERMRAGRVLPKLGPQARTA